MSDDFPDVKLKLNVTFPASVNGGTGISIAKSGGSYTINLDYSEFMPPVGSIPDPANTMTLFYNSLTGTYMLAPFSLVVDPTPWTDYTPTVTAQTPGVTPPTFSAIAGRYKQIGKSVFMCATFTVSAAGTGTGYVTVSLPGAMIASFLGGMAGALASGVSLGVLLRQTNFGNNAVVLKYDSSTVIQNGNIIAFSGVYEAA